MRFVTSFLLCRSIAKSMRPKALPPANAEVTAIPSTSCAMAACVCPAMITSTSPRGSACARLKISEERSQDDRSAGSSNRLQKPPACAATMTIAAPSFRSLLAYAATLSAKGASARPRTLAEIVSVKPLAVNTPTIPTLMPAARTTEEGFTLGQLTGCPLEVSIRLAARKGTWLPLRAPRVHHGGSSLGLRGVAAGPRGPKSNS